MTILDYLEMAMNKQNSDYNEKIKKQVDNINEKLNDPSNWKIDKDESYFECSLNNNYCKHIKTALDRQFKDRNIDIRCIDSKTLIISKKS